MNSVTATKACLERRSSGLFLRGGGLFRLTGIVLLITYLSACHSWATESVSPQEVIRAKAPEKVRVVRTSGDKQVLHEPRILRDTLMGSWEEPNIPLRDVQAIQTLHTDAVKTTVVVVGVGLILAGLVVAVANTSNLKGLGTTK